MNLSTGGCVSFLPKFMFAKLLSFTFYLFFCINIHFFYEYQEYRSCNGKDRYVTGALYKNVKYQTESQSYPSNKSGKLNCKLLHTGVSDKVNSFLPAIDQSI